ncbi:hypothetical protein EMCRGX_G009842 [Ephydatia muelleri]
MAAAIGKIGEFDSSTEDWASYLERLQCYLLANDVADDKNGTREAHYTAALTAHLTPKPLVIAVRFRFHKREQKEEEPVRVYAASLQKLAEHSLEEAEMAERAARDAAQFHESGPIVEVHQVPKKTERCYRCEGQHNPQTCWALKEECRYCPKPGHIERTCRKKLRDNRFKKSSHKVKKVEEAALQRGESDETIEEEGIHVIGAEQWQQNAPVFVTCEFNHIPLKMTMARLKTYSGEPLAVQGQINVKVKKGETEVQLPLLVIDGQGPPLMGRN